MQRESAPDSSLDRALPERVIDGLRSQVAKLYASQPIDGQQRSRLRPGKKRKHAASPWGGIFIYRVRAGKTGRCIGRIELDDRGYLVYMQSDIAGVFIAR
jgi:hypothetical protein